MIFKGNFRDNSFLDNFICIHPKNNSNNSHNSTISNHRIRQEVDDLDQKFQHQEDDSSETYTDLGQLQDQLDDLSTSPSEDNDLLKRYEFQQQSKQFHQNNNNLRTTTTTAKPPSHPKTSETKTTTTNIDENGTSFIEPLQESPYRKNIYFHLFIFIYLFSFFNL